MEFEIGGKRVRPDPSRILGEGGEAVVYNISHLIPGTALKVLRLPTDSFYQGDDEQAKRNRDGATKRIALYQTKLPAFPQNLPAAVIAPRELARRRGGQILGYTMPLIGRVNALRELGQVAFRRQSGFTNSVVTELFMNLRSAVDGTHQAGVVIGDFNSMNVLVDGPTPYLIDADSMQFGGFPALTFTSRYVDPLICDPKRSSLVQIGAHSVETDWYAFAVMLLESMTFVHPYGGVHRPSKGERLSMDARPLKRITVFHPDVIYPRAGIPLGHLPDDLLHFLAELFERDKRGEFPKRLLEDLRWCSCTQCGTEHARVQCPNCKAVSHLAARKEIIKGAVHAVRQFATTGRILEARVQDGALKLLYHESDTETASFKREGGRHVLTGKLSQMRYRIWRDRTVFGVPGQLAIVSDDSTERRAVDSYRGKFPVFDTNSEHLYWISNGRLLRDDAVGDKFIGDVLAGQTLFWVGEKFGFGFYQAGGVMVGFVFDAKASGIKDTVALPPFKGELLDATCSFSESRAWFFAETNESGVEYHYCYVIDARGAVLATEKAAEGSDSWLDTIHSKLALTVADRSRQKVHALLAATEAGLVRVEERGGVLLEAATFPDTQGIIAPGERLLPARTGLYSVGSKRVELVEIR
jgi:H/ACA ribonucleoprotein complex subunit 3